METTYTYETSAEWTGRRGGSLSTPGLPALEVSSPPEFSGEPGKWTPEHLLVASSASCWMATFVAIAEISHLRLASLRISASAKLERVPNEGYRFTEIILRPEIGVAAEDEEKARRVLAKTEKGCFVTNSLRASVVVEPRVLMPEAVC
jgi:peroxiredoxin-like protein